MKAKKFSYSKNSKHITHPDGSDERTERRCVQLEVKANEHKSHHIAQQVLVLLVSFVKKRLKDRFNF